MLALLLLLAADQTLTDPNRNRLIPIEIHEPSHLCGKPPCPIAFLSGGYGSTTAYKSYSFLVKELQKLGYLTIAVQHELESDPPIPTTGDIFQARAPFWKSGFENLLFVRQTLRSQYPQYHWDQLTLIGHSNGGDISCWFTRQHPEWVSRVITLDHRRVPLPRSAAIKTLSIRATDFIADVGVLPSAAEQKEFGIRIVTIPGAKHNDLSESGSPQLKQSILAAVRQFLAP